MQYAMDGGEDHQARVCSVDLHGHWDGDSENGVFLDIKIEFVSISNNTLPVIDLSDAFHVHIHDQRVFPLKSIKHIDHDTFPPDDIGCCTVVNTGENYPTAEFEEQNGESCRVSDETPRKLYTREMTLLPSPLRQRIFPKRSNNVDHETSNNCYGISNDEDEAVFDLTTGVADLRDWDRIMEEVRVKKTDKRVHRRRPSLPEFDIQDPSLFIHNDDKENKDPTTKERRPQSIAPFREVEHSRDPTVIHIPSSRPEFDRVKSENPISSHCETLIPLSPSPQYSVTIPKRDVTRYSPQKGQISRIPVKRQNIAEAHNHDNNPKRLSGFEKKEIPGEIFTSNPFGDDKASSPLARMSKACETLSCPETPPVLEYSLPRAETEQGKRNFGKQKFDSEPRPTRSKAYPSLPSTPTKPRSSRHIAASTPRKLSRSQGHAWINQSATAGLDGAADIFPDSEGDAYFALPCRDNDETHGIEAGSSSPGVCCMDCHNDDSGSLEKSDFDVTEFYGWNNDEDGAQDTGSQRCLLDESIPLPSPSTSSQLSMPWFSAEGLVSNRQSYLEDSIPHNPIALENPTLESINGILTLILPANVIQGILLYEARVQLCLRDQGIGDHKGLNISCPQVDSGKPVGIKWQMNYERPYAETWVPKLSMISSVKSEQERQDAASQLTGRSWFESHSGLEKMSEIDRTEHLYPPLRPNKILVSGGYWERVEKPDGDGDADSEMWQMKIMPDTHSDYSLKASIQDLWKWVGSKRNEGQGYDLRVVAKWTVLVFILIATITTSLYMVQVPVPQKPAVSRCPVDSLDCEEEVVFKGPTMSHDHGSGNIHSGVQGDDDSKDYGIRPSSVLLRTENRHKKIRTGCWVTTCMEDSSDAFSDGNASPPGTLEQVKDNDSSAFSSGTAGLREIVVGNSASKKDKDKPEGADDGVRPEEEKNEEEKNKKEAGKESMRDQIDWFLGWRGPLVA